MWHATAAAYPMTPNYTRSNQRLSILPHDCIGWKESERHNRSVINVAYRVEVEETLVEMIRLEEAKFSDESREFALAHPLL